MITRSYRRAPAGYAVIDGTLRDRRALLVGGIVSVAVLSSNVVGGEGVVWTLFPAAFFGFVAASIIHYVQTRRSLDEDK